MEKLYLYDTTLRDGGQTPGIDFSLEEKRKVIKLLDQLGVDYIEGGYPGANLVDSALFENAPKMNAHFMGFGMTKRAGISVSNDPGLNALLSADCDSLCFVAKASEYQVKVALNTTLEENLNSIHESVKATIAKGKGCMLDCEHFFDGYKENAEFALDCIKTAYEAGASWVILCDTNGGTLPPEIYEIVRTVKSKFPEIAIGIHAHNDTGNAVANSLAAIDAGARQVQGTLNGIGERCGNADLISLIPTLCLKEPYASKYQISVDKEQLSQIKSIAHRFDELLNRNPERQQPYVGDDAFATKAGIHASGLGKNTSTYEHVPPESVGNTRSVRVSSQGGKSNVLAALKRLGLHLDKDDPALPRIIEVLNESEAKGFAYESAEASFLMLALRVMGKYPRYFKTESFRVSVERRFNAIGEQVSVSEAVVKINIDGEIFMSVAEGNGPVNALDLALRKDLGKYSEKISGLELVDFKVRILNGGTEATTRVLIDSQDENGNIWTTVGLSENIVDASFQALEESILYKLYLSEQQG